MILGYSKGRLYIRMLRPNEIFNNKMGDTFRVTSFPDDASRVWCTPVPWPSYSNREGRWFHPDAEIYATEESQARRWKQRKRTIHSYRPF